LEVLELLKRMPKMERIEKYENNLGITGWHPNGLSEVERREELELIRRVIGLLERVVPERFPRVAKESVA
jgi:hypothetical protein